MANMRAKLKVARVERVSDTQENLTFNAVGRSQAYPTDGSDENNTFARFTPNAELKMTVQNPELLGKFEQGQEFYVDFTPVLNSENGEAQTQA